MALLRRTKIVCTIGPASSPPSMLERLMEAGMDVARLNFSHGSHEGHAAAIAHIRTVSERLGKPVAILQDLPGPKIRTGPVAAGAVPLVVGRRFTLTTRHVAGDDKAVEVNLLSLPRAVNPGDTLFLDDGRMELRVQATTDTDIETVVVVGGELTPERGINAPGVELEVPALTSEDVAHLHFGLQQGVDLVALSFVRRAADILAAKKIIQQKSLDTPVLAKIEKHEAMAHIDEIVEAADGLMVARGDLGVEIPLQQVPLAQKTCIRKSNRLGKPVITATQMMESMVTSQRPTRAEVSDVANAIFDGTDALMLSAETAIGRYPVEAVRIMAQVATEAEAALPYRRLLEEKAGDLQPEIDDAISYSAVHVAYQLGAAAIVASTSSGSTARRISKYRPRVPLLAITPHAVTRRRLALSWGVQAVQVERLNTIEELMAEARRVALATGLVGTGQTIVLVAGAPVGRPGTTNMLRVEVIAQ